MKLSANGWSHLALRVTDLARAKRFYVDTLGCPLVRETERAVFVTVAGLLIALLGYCLCWWWIIRPTSANTLRAGLFVMGQSGQATSS